MNHDTYFSFVVDDIKKPDIKNLNQLFFTGFIKELNKLNLINTEQETQLKNIFSEVFLHKSINNRKVIGNINNLIKIMKYYKYNYDSFQDFLSRDTFLNTYLLKKENSYFEAKDAMKNKINLLFKETANV